MILGPWGPPGPNLGLLSRAAGGQGLRNSDQNSDSWLEIPTPESDKKRSSLLEIVVYVRLSPKCVPMSLDTVKWAMGSKTPPKGPQRPLSKPQRPLFQDSEASFQDSEASFQDSEAFSRTQRLLSRPQVPLSRVASPMTLPLGAFLAVLF